ncbi:type 1 glutamine amidotransferase domain-containing protein [Bacillus sp. NEB1478]|uniref:type 1 glutamine amidotransferase domain-containing protein n=1 Tax=Bacillus sp. NEB1478 TaxID=3073816 RepID=UPI0028734791|nr:type 1 glutamine amidotransferase domain-containing protein [Bacillus sp. NEB1478]WNB91258.1 type 1 glutamine amidotransferase domain-containing protein [Bacillus sp. NEB1478]
MSKRILIVVTNHQNIGTNKTGLWLEEYAVPFNEFRQSGYDITVKSIQGGKIPLDPNSLEGVDREEYKEALSILEDTAKLSNEDAVSYDAIFLPGGHGTVFDFPKSEELKEVVSQMAQTNKVIGSVCHGPAGLTTATLKDGTPIVKGKTVTAFTDEEEEEMQLTKEVPFLLETKLRELGAEFQRAGKWEDFAVTDGNLITGQNPQSSRSVAIGMIEVLNKQ